MDELSKEYKYEYEKVLTQLLVNPGSFIIQYPGPRPNNAHRWFFIPNNISKQSQIISSSTGKFLLEKKWIHPELSDEEFEMQYILGSIDYRIYKINEDSKFPC